MNTTTTSSPTSKPFVDGLIDEILANLPLTTRIDLIFNWSMMFSTPGYKPDPAIVEIFGTITTLDFHGSQEVNEETFPKIINLPFSSSLRHINLSNSSIGQLQVCIHALGHPIFQHLEILDLERTQLQNLHPLLEAPHSFPNLHTLNLSSNDDLYIPTIATTTKFPNLKVLNMMRIKLDPTTIEAFAATTTPSPTILPVIAPFQLEKLSIGCTWNHFNEFNAQSLTSLSRSPHLTRLHELAMAESSLTMDMVNELFDPNTSVLKNLIHLKLDGLVIDGGYSPLVAIAQSPLLSNLVKLELGCDCLEDDPDKVEAHKQYPQQFLNSPFLWTPRLKHLTLKNMPGEFVFDDLIPALNTASVKLQTLNLIGTQSSINALSTASCLSELEELRINTLVDLDQQEVIEAFIQSPILSKCKVLPLSIIGEMTSDQLVSMLSSPNMSNDLIEIDLSLNYERSLKDVIRTLCTQRIIPGDETSPLKYGKLRSLDLSQTTVSDDDIELIVGNLTQLAEINLNWARDITDKTIDILLATERDDPCHPYSSLPNLIYLYLTGLSIALDRFYQSLLSQQLDG